jgi:acyl-CoA thioesterase
VSELLDLLSLTRGAGDSWLGTGYGPAGKRLFGGQLLAHSLAAASESLPDVDGSAKLPTSLHLQFLRGGTAGEAIEYDVERTYDGRTGAVRRVLARQSDRILTAATVSFSAPLAGPEHGRYDLPDDPDTLPHTGPAGPAPGLPLDELDIRIADHGSVEGFVRRLYWRTTTSLSEDPLLHLCVALFVTDVYMIDPALRVHGHSMAERTHRSGTTDASVWFHRPIRADAWNLLESRSPAAARGRGVITATLAGADGQIAATLVQEGLIAARE